MADIHYPGYEDAKARLAEMPPEQLLTDIIDQLAGRDGLPPDASPEDIVREAQRQFEVEWQTPEFQQAYKKSNDLAAALKARNAKLQAMVQSYLRSDMDAMRFVEEGVQMSGSIGATPENNGGLVRIGTVNKRKKKKAKKKN